jgi:Family of unknown function (DUF6069)
MTLPTRPGGPAPPSRPRVDARQLWAGGVATAIVAALVAVVGILVCRWLFNIPILAPRRDGAWGSASTGLYALSAAAAALVATALMYLLAVATPRPGTFFSWIIGLVTVIAVVFPFSTTAPVSEKAATAVVNLVLGIAIGSLVAGVTSWATTVPDDEYLPRHPHPPTRAPDVQERDRWR